MNDFFSDIKSWSDEKINEKIIELNRKAALASYTSSNRTLLDNITMFIEALENERYERFSIKQQELWEKQFSSTINTDTDFENKKEEKKKSGSEGVKKKLPNMRFNKTKFGEE